MKLLFSLLLAFVLCQISFGKTVPAKPISDSSNISLGDASDLNLEDDLLDEVEKESQANQPSFFSRFIKKLGLGGSNFAQGEKAYKEEDYDLALQKFMEEKLDNPESQELNLNIGNVQYKKKKYDEALKSYEQALVGDNSQIAAKAYYNMGNAHFRKGEFAIQSGNQQGIQDYRNAMAHYKKSLEINPDNMEAKQNIEVVQARIKELLEQQKNDNQQQQQNQNQQKQPEPSDRAKEVLARALQLVKERKYEEAKNLLEGIIQEDETAISFQSYVQRIQDTMDIMAGRPVSPPVPQDPRSNQQGLGVI